MQTQVQVPAGFRDPVDQVHFQFPFSDFAGQAQEFEVVRIFRDLLRKIGRRRACPFKGPVQDHVQQDISRPPMLDGRRSIGNTIFPCATYPKGR
ncbi:hypothetical protein ACSBOX_19110 [Arthrobacter sp. KN11-1C]|uniref:hypothetical protein n=1 Tax=Arthrobacter sp. KN11-1C TaxID=3445774 RepID=UPI003F9F3759